MPLDPHCARVLKLLGAAASPGAAPTPTERRQALDDLARLATGEPLAAQVEDIAVPTDAGLLRLRAYAPLGAGPDPLPALVYAHGGGWVAGGLDTHDSVCRALAVGGSLRVFAVDYRLAPEHPFPAGLNDAVAAVRWVAGAALELGVDVGRLVLAGDSAGANLAVSAAAALGPGGVARLLLLCPILDIGGDHPSRRDFAEGYFITQAALEADTADYLGVAGQVSDPRVSPLLTPDLTGLPPMHIHVAEFDPFRDEGRAFAARLEGTGVSAVLTEHPGMIHYFYALPRLIPAARKALSDMAKEVRGALG